MEDNVQEGGVEPPPVAPGKAAAPEQEQAKAKSKKSKVMGEPAWSIHANCPTHYDAKKWVPKEGWNAVGAPWQWQTCVLSKTASKEALCLYCPKVCHPQGAPLFNHG